ncbi:MAG: GNAT family N-acetyltransferase [Planctomycetota bacterium]
MAADAPDSADSPLQIRTYRPDDQATVLRLYEEGLLAGQVRANDTGADLDHVEAAYFDSERHHFWIAELEGKVAGMIGVNADEEHTAEVRRLRVEPGFVNPIEIAERLLWTAIDHCKRHGFLKVRLDTSFEKHAAVGLFDSVGFQHTRTKTVQGKELLEFYVDLYRDPQQDEA